MAVPRAGRAVGLLGAVYNVVVMALLRVERQDGDDLIAAACRHHRAAVGVVAWFVPAMVGGGDTLTQAILSNQLSWKA